MLLVQEGPVTIFKGSLVCKTSVLRTFNSCSTTTHHTPLIIHHSSCTAHHTPLIIHHSSYTTHHTLYSSYTTHHTLLIIHYSSYTTHHTRLITHHPSYTTHHTPLIHQLKLVAGAALCEPPCADFVAGAALCEPPCADVVVGAALCEPPCADFVAGTALCAPPCADFVAGARQNGLWRDSEGTKCCIFQWNRWLRSWQVKVCGTTVARRSRVMLGSCSESSVHWD